MNRPNWYPRGTMPKPFVPRNDISDLDLAFGAAFHIEEMLPPVEDIPEEFPNQDEMEKLFNTWFYNGVKDPKFYPREEINAENAYNHLRCIMGSYAPKHEYKIAAWTYLASLWFETVDYD